MSALALRAGCSTALISLLEGGKTSARPESLVVVARALGCSITDLMPDGRPPVTEAEADEFWAAIARARDRDGAITAPDDTIAWAGGPAS